MLTPSWYKAVVESVWPRDGKFGEFWEWTLLVEGVRLKAFTSANLKNEKTQQYLTAVLNYTVEPDDDFYTDSL